jgi:hypothetical protein
MPRLNTAASPNKVLDVRVKAGNNTDPRRRHSSRPTIIDCGGLGSSAENHSVDNDGMRNRHDEFSAPLPDTCKLSDDFAPQIPR